MINILLVCYLQKVFYDLKQAFYIWYNLILEFLQRLAFTKTNVNYNIFVSYNKSPFISIYIDNLLIIGKDLNIINNLNNKLLKRFCIIDLGLVSYYLDILIIQLLDFVSLDQKSFLKKILL